MNSFILALVAMTLTSAMSSVSFAGHGKKEIPTVQGVDLNSYVGLWYEIRRIENEFQDNEPAQGEGVCYNVTAEYSFLPKGKIGVKNTCNRNSGAFVAKAKAQAVKGSNNAKLKVNFTGIPFLEWLGVGNGDYWVLALGEKNADNQYSWVLVGSPTLEYGWILSRTPELPESEIHTALAIAESVGYDAHLFKSFQR
ncbi:lipocalin family protein [Bdellovibrio sp. ArHS]|uniref:lipocalin family protein n=1 Tax=Bdellovibrio sp. ArHS TaxID=1569284 RepID=UPI000A938C0A|nr:lipocalin family protein [Bdellovibrio sp. ArHS]